MSGNEFASVLQGGLLFLAGSVKKLADDGELSMNDTKDIKGCLRTIEDAIEAYEKQIEEACLAAATQGRESKTEI